MWSERFDAFVANYAVFSGALARCQEFWKDVPPEERVPVLLEVLARYRECRGQDLACGDDPKHLAKSFALNELTASCYALGLKPTEDQALAILRTAHHTCGHGNDVRPPLDYALRHYRNKPYTHEFFDALREYSKSLSHTRSTSARAVKRRIDFILWQDLREQDAWKRCWTQRIRTAVLDMPRSEQTHWKNLFHGFHYLDSIEPAKTWHEACEPRLRRLSLATFRERMRGWLKQPVHTPKPELSPYGSGVLKHLIWCATAVADPALDRALMSLMNISWKNRQPMEKVAGALAFLWGQRDRRAALPHLEQLAPYAYPGSKIENYYRIARDACRAST